MLFLFDAKSLNQYANQCAYNVNTRLVLPSGLLALI